MIDREGGGFYLGGKRLEERGSRNGIYSWVGGGEIERLSNVLVDVFCLLVDNFERPALVVHLVSELISIKQGKL